MLLTRLPATAAPREQRGVRCHAQGGLWSEIKPTTPESYPVGTAAPIYDTHTITAEVYWQP